jgi:hypothetical protein
VGFSGVANGEDSSGMSVRAINRDAPRGRVPVGTRRAEANRVGTGGMPGASLTSRPSGKARPDRLALEPYWGKPAVRHLRGGGGNVGIIRSPIRATALPDSRRPPRVPCSDTRLTGRVTFPRESSGRKSSAAGDVSPGRIGPGGRATARAVASRTPMVSVETLARLKPMSGLLEEPTHLGNEEGDRSRDASGIGTCFSSRRRGDGTRGRSADPKWGRSRRQPRPDRRARPPV